MRWPVSASIHSLGAGSAGAVVGAVVWALTWNERTTPATARVNRKMELGMVEPRNGDKACDSGAEHRPVPRRSRGLCWLTMNYRDFTIPLQALGAFGGGPNNTEPAVPTGAPP